LDVGVLTVLQLMANPSNSQLNGHAVAGANFGRISATGRPRLIQVGVPVEEGSKLRSNPSWSGRRSVFAAI